ncbi:MAG: acyl-CoA thioesterase II [Cyclobacteriaceae bacterium]
MKSTKELIDHLTLEPIEINIFRGQSHSIGSPRVFGGQVLAQALEAANQTVPEDRNVHSLHGYFILAGDIERPIVYQVDRIRDGKSFTTRRVVAYQHGKAIFNMSASFHVHEEGFDHQLSAPDVTPPDELQDDHEVVQSYAASLPPKVQAWLNIPRPIEFRSVEPPTLQNMMKPSDHHHVWFKAKGEVPDLPRLHQTILAYASDYNLLGAAVKRHGKTFLDMKLTASLDHAMWFHRSFKVDDWLLYSLDSPSASNARGFTRGSVFDSKGNLVASVVQEGLIRPK